MARPRRDVVASCRGRCAVVAVVVAVQAKAAPFRTVLKYRLNCGNALCGTVLHDEIENS